MPEVHSSFDWRKKIRAVRATITVLIKAVGCGESHYSLGFSPGKTSAALHDNKLLFFCPWSSSKGTDIGRSKLKLNFQDHVQDHVHSERLVCFSDCDCCMYLRIIETFPGSPQTLETDFCHEILLKCSTFYDNSLWDFWVMSVHIGLNDLDLYSRSQLLPSAELV